MLLLRVSAASTRQQSLVPECLPGRPACSSCLPALPVAPAPLHNPASHPCMPPPFHPQEAAKGRRRQRVGHGRGGHTSSRKPLGRDPRGRPGRRHARPQQLGRHARGCAWRQQVGRDTWRWPDGGHARAPAQQMGRDACGGERGAGAAGSGGANTRRGRGAGSGSSSVRFVLLGLRGLGWLRRVWGPAC